MHYLTHWRMQMAAGLLSSGAASVATIAEDVGYESEAAFSRAFKKLVGAPPATGGGSGRRQRKRRNRPNDLMTSFYMRTPSDILVEYG